MLPKNKEQINNRKFILVTADYSGLGFVIQEINANDSECIIARKPKEEFESDENEEAFYIQAEGICDTYDLDDIIESREEYRDWYWMWDSNHAVDECELLKEENFKVFSQGEFGFNLEEDREFGLEFAEECGLYSPEYKEFNSVEEGIKFLEEHEEQAYVYKPNDQDSCYTTVPINDEPINANKEIRELIKALGFTDYILQEKVKGVEVNIESWYMNGEPVVTFGNLENKKSHSKDMGGASGCAFDCTWVVNNNCKLAELTVRKFDKKLRELNYTGFFDANVIISDNDKVHFLEFCGGRLGFNFHPNVFYNLSNKTCFQVLADLIDGIFETTFRKGFGATVSLFNNHYKIGLPIYVPESVKNKFYLFDGYEEDEQLKMGGFSKEIGIACDHDYTIPTSLESAMNVADKITFTNRYYRTDCTNTDTANSIIRRYEALNAMNLI